MSKWKEAAVKKAICMFTGIPLEIGVRALSKGRNAPKLPSAGKKWTRLV